MILSDEQRPQGIEMLVSAMEKAQKNWKKAKEGGSIQEEIHFRDAMAIIANILGSVTGEKRGMEVAKWRQYADGLRQTVKKTP
jgi:hypothetical protein